MGSEDDIILLEQMGQGDERAYLRFVVRHKPRLSALAFRFLGDHPAAEEAVHDTLIKVWKHAGRFDPKQARLTTWLYRIAANTCLDALRLRRRWQWFTLEAAGDVISPQPLADEKLHITQELAAVRRDFMALPDRQRLALLLVLTNECSAADVGRILETTQGAAEQLIVRARQTLREKRRERELK